MTWTFSRLVSDRPFARFSCALCAGVAVGYWRIDKLVFLVQEGEVNAPGVDADAVGRLRTGLHGLCHALLDIIEQRLDVPPVMTVDKTEVVIKALDLFQVQFVVLDAAAYHASASGAEINS